MDEKLESLEEPLNQEPEQTQQNRKTAEDERLGGRPPLATVVILGIGPIISQLGNATFLIINTLWISKAIGDSGLAAVSLYNAFDMIGRSFGFFLSLAASSQVSALFGLKRPEEASQVCADLLRLVLVFGAFVPIVLLPSIKPCGRWFGASEDIIQKGWDYMLPLSAGACCSILYLNACGILQGEGRTMLYGLVNFGCLVLNGLALDPLFLFGIKTGMKGVSLATILSELIPGITLFALYFFGKFGVKLKVRQLFQKFSPRTWLSLKVGVSQLISQLSISLPSIIVRKFMGMCLEDDVYDEAMAGFNGSIRLTGIVLAFGLGVTLGFIPAASYAYASKQYKRYLRLCFHSFWICCAFGCLFLVLIMAFSKTFIRLFSSDPVYVEYGSKMLRISNIANPVIAIRFNCQTMLQSMQLGGRAVLAGLVNNFLLITVAAVCLYYTNKHDGPRMLYAYPISYVLSIPVAIAFLWSPIKKVWQLSKEEETHNAEEEELTDTEIKREEQFVDNDKEPALEEQKSTMEST